MGLGFGVAGVDRASRFLGDAGPVPQRRVTELEVKSIVEVSLETGGRWQGEHMYDNVRWRRRKC